LILNDGDAQSVKIIGRNIVGSLASARRTIALVHCRGRTLALALGCLLHKRYFKEEALLCSWESLLRSGTVAEWHAPNWYFRGVLR
jgi:hypothetical protein